ncbi:hypothetical protein EFL95_16335 [Nocardioides marmorisolisilvae]|uniref:Uncharacterized protein n=2 Tax=Nocardioides marmorisolisilvae TaxID=1542737 RepID=A0A3N0DPK1_9ACTN|nr:hypothetical protein EFL95_16335 [Nocardioides marmorisolisilvae]
MDLAAGTVITLVGIDALRRADRKELVPFAALPLLFGTHQLVETFVWWRLQGHVSQSCGDTASWVYVAIALLVVPIVVPIAVQATGVGAPPALGRLFIAAGVCAAMFDIVGMARGWDPQIQGHRIAYNVDVPLNPLPLGLYVIAACAPALLSRVRAMQLFGGTNLVVVALLVWLAQSALVSLWCVWAAFSSVLINISIRRLAASAPEHHRNSVEGWPWPPALWPRFPSTEVSSTSKNGADPCP